MGYTLTIGELVIRYDQDDCYPNVALTADLVSLPNAPAFDEPTDYTNQRWPSYSAWDAFSRQVGLHGLFYDTKGRDDALLRMHPGCVPLTNRHRDEVNVAFEAFKASNPDAQQNFENDANGFLCRLTWLHFWVNWAMDNCARPVFANS